MRGFLRRASAMKKAESSEMRLHSRLRASSRVCAQSAPRRAQAHLPDEPRRESVGRGQAWQTPRGRRASAAGRARGGAGCALVGQAVARKVQAGEALVLPEAVHQSRAVGVGEGVEEVAQAEGRERRGRGEEARETREDGGAERVGAEGEGVEGLKGAPADGAGDLLAHVDGAGFGHEVSVQVEDAGLGGAQERAADGKLRILWEGEGVEVDEGQRYGSSGLVNEVEVHGWLPQAVLGALLAALRQGVARRHELAPGLLPRLLAAGRRHEPAQTSAKKESVRARCRSPSACAVAAPAARPSGFQT